MGDSDEIDEEGGVAVVFEEEQEEEGEDGFEIKEDYDEEGEEPILLMAFGCSVGFLRSISTQSRRRHASVI